MRTIRTKIYQFDELNNEAQENAIDNYRNKNYNDDFYYDEIKESIKAFCDEFNLKTGRTYSDLRTDSISNDVLNLTGVRLYKYLLNNYSSLFFEAKTYYFVRNENGTKRFNCIGANGGTYKSKCQINNSSCPLTGVCYDEDILQPLKDFIKKPNSNTTFEDLFNDVENAISKCFNDTEDFLNSDDYIKDTITANEYEFTKDGNQF